jgi:hypothetical protein
MAIMLSPLSKGPLRAQHITQAWIQLGGLIGRPAEGFEQGFDNMMPIPTIL